MFNPRETESPSFKSLLEGMCMKSKLFIILFQEVVCHRMGLLVGPSISNSSRALSLADGRGSTGASSLDLQFFYS